MAKQVLSNLDFNNQAKLVNLPNPTNPQDAATKDYVDVAIEGLAQKDNVRVASTGNVNLASPPAAIDGITLVSGQRVLIKDQTTQSENGIYIFNGAGVAMTRALDANTATELLSAVTTVDEGTTNAGTSWRQTAIGITLGTTNILWTPFGVVAPPASTTTAGIIRIATQSEADAGAANNLAITPLTLAAWVNRIRKFTATFGDGASTQFDLSHNFNTNDINVEVYRAGSPFDKIECDVERVSVNAVRLRFAVAPALNSFRVVVLG